MNTISAHLAHLRAAGFSPNTIEDRDCVLRRVDRELPMGLLQATVEELENWLAGPADHRRAWSNQTKATYYGHVVGFYAWAADPNRRVLDWNPAQSLQRPKVPDTIPNPVSNEELAMILRCPVQPWNRLAYLAACAGLRAAELAMIRREHINEDWIRFIGKGGKERLVWTHPTVWIVVRDLPPGLIGEGITPAQMTREGNRHLRRIAPRPPGSPGVTWHKLRHWFGTYLLMPRELGGAGADLRTVQELLGHASPATTAIYTQITNEQRRIAVAALPVPAPALP